VIRLNTKDASILARVAQYENLPLAKRRAMLEHASADAQEIGLVLLRVHDTQSPEVNELVAAIRGWVTGNRDNRRGKRTGQSFHVRMHPHAV
jgi:hypothetical protein